MQTVVGLYRSIDEANKAKQALLNEGYSGGDITVIDQSEGGYGNQGGYETAGVGSRAYASGTGSSDYSNGVAAGSGSGVSGLTGENASVTDPALDGGTGYNRTDTNLSNSDSDNDRGEGVGAKIKHFFQNLTGHDEHTHRAYTEGVQRGGALVAVNVTDGEEERAAGVLRQYGATEIEGDNSGYGANTGSANYGANTGDFNNTGRTNVSGEQVIPVAQEELQVGKRQVERGGVRVYSHVVSQPVRESVNLHEERVVVDRHAVNRPATDADFRDAGPIEVRAMGEEAVVAKTGRVVEEVVVGKAAADRTQTVEDTVRRTEVDVEQVNTNNQNTGTNTTNTNDPNNSRNRY